MEKLLIIGATGNVGSAVLKKLQNKEVEVFAGVRKDSDKEKISNLGMTPVVVDFTDLDSLNNALKGMDRVFLVTPLMQNPEYITQLVLEASKTNNVKHIVRSTALGANSEGQIQMARWAGKSDDMIIASGMDYTILHPNNFLENFIIFHSQTIKEHNAFYAPNGSAKCGMLSVEDIAEVAVLALTTDDHYNKTYNLSGLALTNEEYAESLSKVLGRDINYVDVPEENAKENMLESGLPDWLVDAMMELNYVMKQGWTADYTSDYKNITGKEYMSADDFFEKNKAFFE